MLDDAQMQDHLRTLANDAAALWPDLHPMHAALCLLIVHLDETMATPNPRVRFRTCITSRADLATNGAHPPRTSRSMSSPSGPDNRLLCRLQ